MTHEEKKSKQQFEIQKLTVGGGPAFPIQFQTGTTDGVPDIQIFTGMTLRDYFAAKAMQACINDSWRNSSDFENEPYSRIADGISKDAYAIADAMIAERSKSK